MAGPKRVIIGLAPLGEAGQTALLAERFDSVAATGQDLVRIGLVANIPDQPVMRCLEHIMQRHRQLDDAEPGTKMAACLRHGANGGIAQLGGEPLKIALRQAAQIVSAGNPVQQGG